MYCMYCGAEVNPGQKFCISCGAPVGASSPQSETQPTRRGVSGRYSAPAPRKKRKLPRIAAGFVVGFGVLILLATLLGESDTYFADPVEHSPATTTEVEQHLQAETEPSAQAAQSEYITRAIEVAQTEYQKFIAQQEMADFMQEAHQNNVTIEMLNRQPEHSIDKKVYFGGFVVQALYSSEAPNRVKLRVEVIGNQSSHNVVYVSYTLKNGETRILEDDYVDIYGISKGLITYESVLGNDVTIPHIQGKYVFCSANTDGSLVTPVMEEAQSLLEDQYLSEDGIPSSFSALENNDLNVLSDATDYGDCIVVYYTPTEGWDVDNPPAFYRITVFRDGKMVIFEPNRDAEAGIYSVDDGVYTLYTPS